MRIIRNILIVIVLLVAALAAAAYLQPRHVIVERSITIDAPAEEVFVHLSSLQAFAEWSPWGDYDPDMMVEFSGPETGVGNVMEWQSDHENVGVGRQEIIELVENERVRTALQFDGFNLAEAWWTLEADGDATQVTWGLDSDMGNNPMYRWMGLMMDGFVGADYERGLERLRQSVEG